MASTGRPNTLRRTEQLPEVPSGEEEEEKPTVGKDSKGMPAYMYSFNPLPTIGNGLKKQKSMYKVLTPSIKPPYNLLWAYRSS